MSGHAERLWELLLPMGPYSRQGAYTAGELAGEGSALDGIEAALDELEREAMLDTAEEDGLDRMEGLLAHRPVAETPQARRAALAALLRIGGDSFTLTAINDNIKGCGINAEVSETSDPGVVEVRFPDVPGVPAGFEQLRKIIEDILPAHLRIDYVYWYITWRLMESRFQNWENIEGEHITWNELELLVE